MNASLWHYRISKHQWNYWMRHNEFRIGRLSNNGTHRFISKKCILYLHNKAEIQNNETWVILTIFKCIVDIRLKQSFCERLKNSFDLEVTSPKTINTLQILDQFSWQKTLKIQYKTSYFEDAFNVVLNHIIKLHEQIPSSPGVDRIMKINCRQVQPCTNDMPVIQQSSSKFLFRMHKNH